MNRIASRAALAGAWIVAAALPSGACETGGEQATKPSLPASIAGAAAKAAARAEDNEEVTSTVIVLSPKPQGPDPTIESTGDPGTNPPPIGPQAPPGNTPQPAPDPNAGDKRSPA